MDLLKDVIDLIKTDKQKDYDHGNAGEDLFLKKLILMKHIIVSYNRGSIKWNPDCIAKYNDLDILYVEIETLKSPMYSSFLYRQPLIYLASKSRMKELKRSTHNTYCVTQDLNARFFSMFSAEQILSCPSGPIKKINGEDVPTFDLESIRYQGIYDSVNPVNIELLLANRYIKEVNTYLQKSQSVI